MNIKDAKKIVVLVDAYSSGNQLAPAFNKEGYRCLHIQSRSDIPQVITNSYKKDDFFMSLQYAGLDTVKELKKYDIIAVIAGCETGIELADNLAELLHLAGNETKSSSTRRNKYLMQECLKNNNINYIPTYKITNINEATDYASKLLKNYNKLILKPVDSGGTDSVFVCSTIEDVKNYSKNLFETRNQLNLKNEVIILQPLIEGEEYVVDTVSYDGHHKICAIWKMGKGKHNGSNSVCEFTELTSLDEQEQLKLKNYVFNCLDSLNIKFGAGHSEVFLTHDGWTLIETGARLHGAGFPLLSSLALKKTQIDELISSICSTESFLKTISEEYRPQKFLKIKELISSRSGIVKSVKYLDAIFNLASYKKSNIPSIGQNIRLTKDVCSSPGWIALCHSDIHQINADYQYIVELEKKGMFEVY
ncbi:ATP-grasp domain-containing protein [Aristophania vespae]|uniref:ATP-grasp domain-containing protein n=1 Tax=Aristophania vespae TaxID=2697033 RepID=UPI0023516AF1|nr:ATP-grasp domain-containing protein [Aristophania vespae]UMM63049.1 hypothetical protein DM15PD_00020 [Aristophania vespae]